MDEDEFKPSKWWRVLDPEGKLWCETSVEVEARNSMRHGDTIERLYEKVQYEWRKETS